MEDPHHLQQLSSFDLDLDLDFDFDFDLDLDLDLTLDVRMCYHELVVPGISIELLILSDKVTGNGRLQSDFTSGEATGWTSLRDKSKGKYKYVLYCMDPD